MAAAAWRRGADVVLVAGPTTAPIPYGPRLVRVETSVEMARALETELREADVLVMAAAVSDFQVAGPAEMKIKRDESTSVDLRLEAGPDLLADTRSIREAAGVLTLGFALETQDAVANASRKLVAKGMDLVALNEVGPNTGFDSDTNRVTLIDASGVVDEIPLLPKEKVAELLLDHLEERIS